MTPLPLLGAWASCVDLNDERVHVIDMAVGAGRQNKAGNPNGINDGLGGAAIALVAGQAGSVEFYERCARILLAFYRGLVRNFAAYSPKKDQHR